MRRWSLITKHTSESLRRLTRFSCPPKRRKSVLGSQPSPSTPSTPPTKLRCQLLSKTGVKIGIIIETTNRIPDPDSRNPSQTKIQIHPELGPVTGVKDIHQTHPEAAVITIISGVRIVGFVWNHSPVHGSRRWPPSPRRQRIERLTSPTLNLEGKTIRTTIYSLIQCTTKH